MPRPRYGMALAGSAAVIALLALTPAGASILPSDGANGPELYGMAELVHRNADGDLVASQTVHNALVDVGEDILIQGVFGITLLADDKKPDSLCITNVNAANTTDPVTGVPTPTDPDVFTIVNASGTLMTIFREDVSASSLTPNATTFAGGNPTCIPATTTLNDVPGQAVLNATFTSGDNAIVLAPINAVVICNSDTDPSADADCESRGEAFSVVMIPQTNLAEDATLEVTYTFDVTSPTT